MVLIDANYILRYLLRDHESQFLIVKEIIENKDISLFDFIIAEVVYVLEKVYGVNREEIKSVLEDLLMYKNISVSDKAVLVNSFKLYADNAIDFADALLISYYKSDADNQLFTFDKKILKILSSK
jgi:predicted nucleic-acid-binding protein